MRLKIKKLFLYWLPPLVWMGFIFFLSSFHKIQASEVGWQNFVTRKAAHFIEYAILSTLFFRAFKSTTSLSHKRAILASFFLAAFYALTDEYHQTLVPGRTGKLFDLGVDFFGVASGLIFPIKMIDRLPENLRKVLQ